MPELILLDNYKYIKEFLGVDYKINVDNTGSSSIYSVVNKNTNEVVLKATTLDDLELETLNIFEANKSNRIELGNMCYIFQNIAYPTLQEAVHERRLSKNINLMEMLQDIKNMLSAANQDDVNKISEIWSDNTALGDMLNSTKGYPFSKSLDELTNGEFVEQKHLFIDFLELAVNGINKQVADLGAQTTQCHIDVVNCQNNELDTKQYTQLDWMYLIEENPQKYHELPLSLIADEHIIAQTLGRTTYDLGNFGFGGYDKDESILRSHNIICVLLRLQQADIILPGAINEAYFVNRFISERNRDEFQNDYHIGKAFDVYNSLVKAKNANEIESGLLKLRQLTNYNDDTVGRIFAEFVNTKPAFVLGELDDANVNNLASIECRRYIASLLQNDKCEYTDRVGLRDCVNFIRHKDSKLFSIELLWKKEEATRLKPYVDQLLLAKNAKDIENSIIDIQQTTCEENVNECMIAYLIKSPSFVLNALNDMPMENIAVQKARKAVTSYAFGNLSSKNFSEFVDKFTDKISLCECINFIKHDDIAFLRDTVEKTMPHSLDLEDLFMRASLSKYSDVLQMQQGSTHNGFVAESHTLNTIEP